MSTDHRDDAAPERAAGSPQEGAGSGDGAAPVAGAAPDSRSGGRFLIAVAAAIIALVLDVGSKAIVVSQLPLTHQPVKVLGGVIYLDQTRNSGAAFSLGTGFTVILTVVALAVVAVIVRAARRLRSTGWAIALGLILGGALGNLSDRFFRAPGVGRGGVVDWISAFGPNGQHWPIFNIADSAIVVGAVLAGLLTVLGVEFGGRRADART